MQLVRMVLRSKLLPMAAKMVGMHRRMLGMCEQIDIEEERLMI
jgi:hypothetical protein